MQAQHVDAHVWWCDTCSYDNVLSTSSLCPVGWWVKWMGKSAELTKIVRCLTEWRRGQRMICALQRRELTLNLPTIELQVDRPMFHSSDTMNVVKCTLFVREILSPQPSVSRAGHHQASKFNTRCMHSSKPLAMSTLSQ
jgi:hypothetical protein